MLAMNFNQTLDSSRLSIQSLRAMNAVAVKNFSHLSAKEVEDSLLRTAVVKLTPREAAVYISDEQIQGLNLDKLAVEFFKAIFPRNPDEILETKRRIGLLTQKQAGSALFGSSSLLKSFLTKDQLRKDPWLPKISDSDLQALLYAPSVGGYEFEQQKEAESQALHNQIAAYQRLTASGKMLIDRELSAKHLATIQGKCP